VKVCWGHFAVEVNEGVPLATSKDGNNDTFNRYTLFCPAKGTDTGVYVRRARKI
jgi:hypothetical protein